MRRGFLKLSNKCTALHHTVCAPNMHFKRNIHAGSEWMRLELKHLNCAIILHLQHNSLVAYGTRLSFVMIERNELQRHFNRIKIKLNTCFQKHTVYILCVRLQFTSNSSSHIASKRVCSCSSYDDIMEKFLLQ